MSENPRIGKVLRIPIELVPEDEAKINDAIKKIGTLKSEQTDMEREEREKWKEIGKEAKSFYKDKAKDTEDEPNVQEIIALSKDQLTNLIGIAKNPSGAIMGMFMKKFAKGAGAVALALLLLEAVRYAIDYLMRDGMPLDRRFKRFVHNEVFSFLDRLTKMQLRQGYRSVTVTTISRLRGGAGQVGGNLYSISQGTISQKLPSNFYSVPISTGNTKGNTKRFGKR